MTEDKTVLIIGAGLAGCEAANLLANNGVKVKLFESKRVKKNPAQRSLDFAELICSNSLKSMDKDSAHGILKREMEQLGSLILKIAMDAKVPAGGALAVDREQFSMMITEEIEKNPNIEVFDLMVEDPIALADDYSASDVIISSGPLTDGLLLDWIKANIIKSKDDLYFYDAIAPIIDSDSLDMSKLYFKDRYVDSSENREEVGYLNVPLTKDVYEEFVNDINKSSKVTATSFEKDKFFESCLPVDIMAQRGIETLRFSCMKPVGLEMENGNIPYAVIQLRRENLIGSAYNMVGFQNRMKHSDQVEIFRKIPGLERAEFLQLGSVHRNTYINARRVLNSDLSLIEYPNIYICGQLCGVEGYTESAAMGLYSAFQLLQKFKGEYYPKIFPIESAIGALVNYLMTQTRPSPSNINFGIFPSVELTKEERRDRRRRKKIKRGKISKRAEEKWCQAVFTKNH